MELMFGQVFDELSRLLEEDKTGWKIYKGRSLQAIIEWIVVNHNLHELLGQNLVQSFNFAEDISFVMPDGQLLRKLRNDQERAPSSLLLRLDDVAEDVVSHVQNVFASRSDELGKDVTAAARVDLVRFQRSRMAAKLLDARVLPRIDEPETSTP